MKAVGTRISFIVIALGLVLYLKYILRTHTLAGLTSDILWRGFLLDHTISGSSA